MPSSRADPPSSPALSGPRKDRLVGKLHTEVVRMVMLMQPTVGMSATEEGWIADELRRELFSGKVLQPRQLKQLASQVVARRPPPPVSLPPKTPTPAETPSTYAAAGNGRASTPSLPVGVFYPALTGASGPAGRPSVSRCSTRSRSSATSHGASGTPALPHVAGQLPPKRPASVASSVPGVYQDLMNSTATSVGRSSERTLELLRRQEEHLKAQLQEVCGLSAPSTSSSSRTVLVERCRQRRANDPWLPRALQERKDVEAAAAAARDKAAAEKREHRAVLARQVEEKQRALQREAEYDAQDYEARVAAAKAELEEERNRRQQRRSDRQMERHQHIDEAMGSTQRRRMEAFEERRRDKEQAAAQQLQYEADLAEEVSRRQAAIAALRDALLQEMDAKQRRQREEQLERLEEAHTAVQEATRALLQERDKDEAARQARYAAAKESKELGESIARTKREADRVVSRAEDAVVSTQDQAFKHSEEVQAKERRARNAAVQLDLRRQIAEKELRASEKIMEDFGYANRAEIEAVAAREESHERHHQKLHEQQQWRSVLDLQRQAKVARSLVDEGTAASIPRPHTTSPWV